MRAEDAAIEGIEASTLGLKPGEWPETIEFEGRTLTKWNVILHVETGALLGVRYRDWRGVVKVWND